MRRHGLDRSAGRRDEVGVVEETRLRRKWPASAAPAAAGGVVDQRGHLRTEISA
jgi:hypothetical protein